MRKVFIDIGSHKGQSIAQFYSEIEDAADWRIFSFEPLLFESKYENVSCIKAVAGTIDGEVDLFTVPDGGQGATVVTGKESGGVDENNKQRVTSIDFIRWFKENIQDGDFVIIKMNIEGGEYILMPLLPEILPMIAGMHIKLHHKKFNIIERHWQRQVYEDFKRIESDCFIIFDEKEGVYDFRKLVSGAE